jgi:UPF0755 protein
MKKKSIRLPFRLLIIAGLILIGASSLWFRWACLPVDSKDDTVVFISISQGESVDSIAQYLKDKNLIRSKAAFKIKVLTHNLATKIQAGDFKLTRSLSTTQIAESFTHGTSDLRITLIEGWRREEMADELERKFKAVGATFDKQAFLQTTEGKEGYLFPDTYLIPKWATASEISELLQVTFEKKVDNQIRSAINRQGLTLDQAIILASMVEREARFDKDRPLVAGILVKRWRRNWPLQVDAAVQYALGYQDAEKSWWKKSLTKEDLNVNSAYNTYKKAGLPPTPICNPSLASIKAVANLKQSAYWFYLSDSQGNLHYSETIEEHNQNIAKYLGK